MQETQETQLWSLGREDPLEEGMATLSSTVACRIPCTGWDSVPPGGLQSIGPQRVRQDWSTWARWHGGTHTHTTISFNCLSTFFAGSFLCKEVAFTFNQSFVSVLWKSTTLNNKGNKKNLQRRTPTFQARILEWVAVPSFRGSSQHRDWTQISHTAGRFFTSWATREAQEYWRG